MECRKEKGRERRDGKREKERDLPDMIEMVDNK